MATILPFVIPRHGHAPKPASRSAPGGPATVIIFPGVRYERRQDKNTDKDEAARRPRRKRAVQTT